MNDQNNSQPGFYAIIPAHVRYCKELNPHARLLYGELTALTNSNGYCWATNKYFADLYDVNERKIQEWLALLKKNNFIKITYEDEKTHKGRKIYIHFDESKNLYPTPKTASPHAENGTHNNTYNTTSKNKLSCVPGGTALTRAQNLKEKTSNLVNEMPNQFSCDQVTKIGRENKPYTLSISDIFTMAIRTKKDWTAEEIRDVWRIIVEYERPLYDWIAFCESVINKERTLKGLEKATRKGDKKCQKKHKEEMRESKDLKEELNSTKENILEKDSKTQTSANWKKDLGLLL